MVHSCHFARMEKPQIMFIGHPTTRQLRNIPDMVMDRIRRLSSSPSAFKAARNYYQGALEQSGYKGFSTEYKDVTRNGKKKRKRRRRVIWFNPPFSVEVQTELGRKFLGLVARHFPAGHVYSQIFNKNTIKVSYSCMKSIESRIKAHNKKLTHGDPKPADRPSKLCNCKDKGNCPLDGKCLTESLVYEAQLKTNCNQKFLYIGLTGNSFKTRFNQHKHTFSNPEKRTSTRLSEKVWELKDKGTPFGITWKVRKKGRPYRIGDRFCDLCTTEKMEILMESGNHQLLNRRSEIMGSCRHYKKFNL